MPRGSRRGCSRRRRYRPDRCVETGREGGARKRPFGLRVRRRYTPAVDALRLPVVSSAPRALDAASLGLTARADARAERLFDRFGRSHTYLRISVIEKCNLRCRYCMPEEGVPLLPKGDLLSFEEIERLASLFVRLGRLKAHGLERLAMTSNALLLRQHLAALRAGGLDAVNLSLDTLRPA